MNFPRLLVGLLIVLCFTIATGVEPRYEAWKGARRKNALMMLIGDSRRLFANHFFAKADAYFHGGYYPTIFDVAKPEEKSHMEESTEAHGGHEEAEEGHKNCTHGKHEACEHDKAAEGEKHEGGHEDPDFLEAPKDWIEAFNRNFFPSRHSHLENAGDFREILPWLRLTAELDPQKVETYTVAAFTLRTRLNKPAEAEEFLRDGLRANPDSYEILYEIGRLRYEHDKDPQGARNLLELGMKKWHRREDTLENPNIFALAQILAYLAKVEEEQGNVDRAISRLQELMQISPLKDQVAGRIRELQTKQAPK